MGEAVADIIMSEEQNAFRKVFQADIRAVPGSGAVSYPAKTNSVARLIVLRLLQ
jgi:hypothetical protein